MDKGEQISSTFVEDVDHRYEDIDNTIATRMENLRTDVQRAFHGSEENQLQQTAGNLTGKSRIKQTTNCNNITISKNIRGTSRDYLLKRLYRDRRDLYEKVINGQMSATKAAMPP